MFSTWNVQSNVLQYYDVCPCMCVCVCVCVCVRVRVCMLMHMQTPVYLDFTLTECWNKECVYIFVLLLSSVFEIVIVYIVQNVF